MTILEILENKMIPWIERGGLQRLVVTDQSCEQRPLPDGIKFTRSKLKGKRVAVRGPRLHGHVSNVVAVWPKAGLTEVRLPFIVCVVGSRVDYPAGNRIFHCTEGDFLLIPPRTPHPGAPVGDVSPTDEVLDVLALSTWDNHRQCCVCYAMSGNYLIPDPKAVLLLDAMMDEINARRPGSDKVAGSICLALLHLLCREFRAQNYFRAGVTLLDAEGMESRIDPIQRLRQHVLSHLNEPLTIDDACNRALMSRTQFTRRFREATGQSFIEYVTHHRLEQAKVLLNETEWSLAMIAEFIGFQDTTRLHRIFVRYAGMSPNRYRLQSREKQSVKKT